jgi:hypothetical protein
VTKAQKDFALRLGRLLRAMPKSVELIVRHGSIDICATGARDKYFAEHGDADNVPTLRNVDTYRLRVYPGGESL